MQAPPIAFADKPLVFPPPEKWTETQYALYEEPLTSQPVGNQAVTKAVAVRETADLRTNQLVIPRGVEVQVVEILAEQQMCKVQIQGHVGLFKL